jgi:hypothetical protein
MWSVIMNAGGHNMTGVTRINCQEIEAAGCCAVLACMLYALWDPLMCLESAAAAPPSTQVDISLILHLPLSCCCCCCCPAGIFLHCIIAYQVNVNVWCSLLLQLTNPK